MLGARPLRRAIQRYIEDKLSDAMLERQFPEGTIILVDASTKTTRCSPSTASASAVASSCPWSASTSRSPRAWRRWGASSSSGDDAPDAGGAAAGA